VLLLLLLLLLLLFFSFFFRKQANKVLIANEAEFFKPVICKVRRLGGRERLFWTSVKKNHLVDLYKSIWTCHV